MANVTGRSGRQVIMTTHSLDLLADTGIDPAEVLLLRTTGQKTTVTVGSDLEELKAAAEADNSFSEALEALTRPDDYADLAQFGAKP